MKKLLSVILALLMLSFVFVACDEGISDATESGDTEVQTIEDSETESDTELPSVDTEPPSVDTEGEETDKKDDSGEVEIEMPKIDIMNSTASQKYFVGTTNKDAVSYKANEEIIFTVKLQADGELASCPYFKYTLSADDGTSQAAKYVDGSTGTLTVKTKISKAGFVYLKVEACNKNRHPISGVASFNGGAGADISSITKTKSEPADFDEFWNTQLAWLDEVEPELLSCEKYTFAGAVAGYDYYKVKIKFHENAVWGKYVSAYLTVPQNALPGSLDLHVEYNGAGVSDLNKYHSSNAALLNVAAHSMELGQNSSYYQGLANGWLKDYGFNPEYNSSRDTIYFKEMILRDIQAVRFMRKYFAADGPSFTFTDGTKGSFAGLGNGKVNLAGGSQGGFQCMAVAALDGRIDYQIAYCPWLSDIGGYGLNGTQTSDYMPEYTAALEYFDSINFAKRVKCRTMIKTVGLGDTTTPPKGITALYNVLANNGNNVKVDITYWQNRTHSYTAPSGTYDSITVKNY